MSPQTALSRVALLPLITLLVALASAPAPAADAPPAATAPREAAQLSESEAIQIAEDEAKRLRIDLAHFEPPSAAYVSDGHRGKWHLFFVARAEHHDTCFSVDIYRSDVRPHISRCAL